MAQIYHTQVHINTPNILNDETVAQISTTQKKGEP